MDLSDGELLEMARDGHTEAYGLLFTRHAPAAHRVARRRTRDHQLAQDAVHEAFTTILAAIKAGGGPVGTFTAYLFVSVTRQIQRQSRHQSRETLLPEFTDTAATEEDFTEDTSLAPSLLGAFGSLPERWQQVLWHMDISGMPAKEAAPLFGLSPNAVIALHRRAKAGLRKALEQHTTERTGSTTRRGS
ncbi:RNA polymerase sigma factor [Paenarthrobacter sp. NPDC056912]|uniref:RNA polymerase sigma factor n=1 Tax=Paenarthrobacter sp. NPDC056912 TaxID=3345965 RepID=UPI00366BF0E6